MGSSTLEVALEAVDELLVSAARHDDSPDVRREAIAALAERESLGDARLEVLTAALADPDGEVRRAAAVALGRTHDPRAAGLLLDSLERDPSACDEIAATLATVADESTVSRLSVLASSPSSAVRRGAIRCLARIARGPLAPSPSTLNCYEGPDGVVHPLL